MDRNNTYLTAEDDDIILANAALTSNFDDVIVYDYQTGSLRLIKLSGHARGIDLEAYSQMTCYEAVDAYASNNISSDDRRRMMTLLDPTSLRTRLATTPAFIERYHVEREGVRYPYYVKCARLQNTPDFTDVVLAFGRESDLTMHDSEFSPGHGMSTHRKTILIVEDNELNREMLAAILEGDYDILTAENGLIGLDILAQRFQEISAVMLDVNMPLCNGFEFLERVSKDEVMSQVPVIVTTANNNTEDEIRCLELGASDFVAKPYNPQVVRSRLHSIIRLHDSISTLSAVEYDELTGVYTKQAFFVYARNLIRANPNKNVVLLTAKLVNYRVINTMSGQATGTEVIKYLANEFAHLAANGVVCRYESNRFASLVILDEEFSRETMLANVNDLAARAPIPNLEMKYGVYQHADTTLTIEAMCDRSFAALASAEQDPSLTIALFEGAAHQKMEQDQLMEASFSEALANHEFVAYYQPKCNVQTGSIVAAEALVRWIDPDGKMISPGAFIPLFEHDGLIGQLDEYMFREVCHMQSDRLARGERVVPVSVNMSRINLYRHDIVDVYVNIAKEAGVPFNLVPIELTESAAITDAQTHDAIRALAESGFPIHLDDFGSGYSSYASLASLPLTTIKIDKSLMDQYSERSGKIIISTSVTLAKALNMTVVAEGVETEDQMNFLKCTACDLVQGYYYSPPTHLEHFAEMLERGYVK